MNERPILFSAPMVKAILAGTKTQTRRAIKDDDVTKAGIRGIMGGTGPAFGPCKYGSPGDFLWVRETWCESFASDDDSINGFCYRATNNGPDPAKWRPSIFMKRAASRITLEITEVRVERLQDISEKDAKAEGVSKPDTDAPFEKPSLRGGYWLLWDSINGRTGPKSWDANPWVFVISFKRVPQASR